MPLDIPLPSEVPSLESEVPSLEPPVIMLDEPEPDLIPKEISFSFGDLKPSLLCFRHYVPFHLNADVADSIDDVFEHMAGQIRLEVKSIPTQKNYDINSFTYPSAVEVQWLLLFIARLG